MVKELINFGKTIDFNIRRIIEKISSEHRVYESVDDRTLSYRRKLAKNKVFKMVEN